ncbi:hypothetical protein ACLOJK_027669 [Asimina triloba]
MGSSDRQRTIIRLLQLRVTPSTQICLPPPLDARSSRSNPSRADDSRKPHHLPPSRPRSPSVHGHAALRSDDPQPPRSATMAAPPCSTHPPHRVIRPAHQQRLLHLPMADRSATPTLPFDPTTVRPSQQHHHAHQSSSDASFHPTHRLSAWPAAPPESAVRQPTIITWASRPSDTMPHPSQIQAARQPFQLKKFTWTNASWPSSNFLPAQIHEQQPIVQGTEGENERRRAGGEQTPET